MIAAMAGSLLLIAAGWPLASLMERRDARPSWMRRLGESYLCGAAAASAVLFASSLLHIVWSRALVCGALVVIGAAGAAAARARMRVAGARLHAIDAVTLIVLAGYARFATLAPTPEYDFIGIWGVKAKEFWYAGGIDWRFLSHPFNAFAHVDYPLFVPLLFDYHTLLAGVWPDRYLGIVNVCFGASAVLIVRSFFDDEIAAPWLRAVATLAIVSSAVSPWIGLAEGPLVAYGTAGVLYVRRGALAGRSADVLRGALYLGLAASCKNEGLTLIVAAAAGLVIAGCVRRLVDLWPAAAVVLPWMLLRRIHHLQSDLTTGSILPRVSVHLSQLGTIGEAMGRYSLGKPLFWTGILVAVILSARSIARRERFLATTILVQLLFFIAAYLITPHDLTWHIRWSWERIATQMAALVAFLALVPVCKRVEQSGDLR